MYHSYISGDLQAGGLGGVKFTNGREVNAQDVKYSIERIMDPATKSPNTWIFSGVIQGAREMVAAPGPDRPQGQPRPLRRPPLPGRPGDPGHP